MKEIENIITKNEMKNVGLYQKNDTLVINFYKVIHNEKKLFKTLEITKQDNNYRVLILDNNITKIFDLSHLEDVIVAIWKDSNLKVKTQDEINQIKVKYGKGTKIELIKMNDYLGSVPPKTKGIVDYIDGEGKIYVNWENETSSLPLIVGLDEFNVLCPLCGKKLDKRSALSRKDNKTNICSKCGTLEALEIHLESTNKLKKEQALEPQIIIHKGLGELKHKEIVDKLMSKCDSTGAAMNIVLDIVGKHIKDDTKGVNRFMNKINAEVNKTEGQDCLLVNDVLFDWKQLNRPEIVGELVDLALNCMSNENSREKLENMLVE